MEGAKFMLTLFSIAYALLLQNQCRVGHLVSDAVTVEKRICFDSLYVSN